MAHTPTVPRSSMKARPATVYQSISFDSPLLTRSSGLKRIAYPLDCATAVDGDDIESACRPAFAVGGQQPMLSGPPDSLLLQRTNSNGRAAEARAGPHADFDKDQHLAFKCDQIHFAVAVAGVACNDAAARRDQVP